jgi:hypothetical protein
MFADTNCVGNKTLGERSPTSAIRQTILRVELPEFAVWRRSTKVQSTRQTVAQAATSALARQEAARRRQAGVIRRCASPLVLLGAALRAFYGASRRSQGWVCRTWCDQVTRVRTWGLVRAHFTERERQEFFPQPPWMGSRRSATGLGSGPLFNYPYRN